MDVYFWLFLLISILVFALYIYHSYVSASHQYFKKQGVPGPTPHPFIGNLDLLFKMKGNAVALNSYLVKTYGPLCVTFSGSRPALVVSDLSMIREINVKQFDKFNLRIKSKLFKIEVNGVAHDFVFFLSGEQWRKRRRTLSPAFSGHKMKEMMPLINESLVRMMDKIASAVKKDEVINASDLYSKMTMEVILSTAFGRSVDVQGGKGGEVYEAARSLFASIGETSGKYMRYLQFIIFAFPIFGTILSPLAKRFGFKSIPVLSKVAYEIVKKRKNEQNTVPRKDLLQLMIDATDEESKTKLSTGEIVADAVGFLLAGYETTSNALTFTSYLLGAHPGVQERLANEILGYFEDYPDKSMYDATHELEYLDMVFSEGLRMYPLLPVTFRTCTEECIVNGIKIKEGVTIRIPVLNIHYDPKTWKDPETFDPERFTAEEKAKRHPCAYLPFGLGPRNCVGMRFALMEAKMVLIEVLRKYKIQLSPETTVPVEIDFGGTLRPKKGVFVKFIPRE